jgi:hypothetical protein
MGKNSSAENGEDLIDDLRILCAELIVELEGFLDIRKAA